MHRHRFVFGFVLGVLSFGANALNAELQHVPQLRRPESMVLSADERLLFVANRRSGTVSIIDLESLHVVAEKKVGQQLSDIAVTKQGTLLVTDEAAHELVVLGLDQTQQLSIETRIAVPDYPVRICYDVTRQRAYITSLWSRRLSCVELQSDSARLALIVNMPFAPREMVLADSKKLLIADAYGGRLAVFDMLDQRLEFTHKLPAHNIRGMALRPDSRMLVVSHQILNELAHTVRPDVHWGGLMSNDLRWLPIDEIVRPDGDLFNGSHIHGLGIAGDATADPAGLSITQNGTVVVALSGVAEVAVGKEGDFQLKRVKVGRRPTSIVTHRSAQIAFVANSFSDSISKVDLLKCSVEAEISLGPSPALTAADRGELLFYDGTLSHDGWMSCHSCHTDGHTNGMQNDNLSDGTFGAPKRILSLLGSRETAPYAWNAGVEQLSSQIRKSIADTMIGDREPTNREVDDLAAYLRTLDSPPSLSESRGTLSHEAVLRGEDLFHEQRCDRCHEPPQFTSPRTYNVGLADALGKRRFNPPSLRGVSQRGPYFHDNRGATLESVFRDHRHQLREPISEVQLRDLVSYLHSL